MNSPSDNKGLNGLRIPLIINGSMLISLVIGGTTMWNKVEYLERQYSNSVSAVKIAELEGEINLQKADLARAVRDLKAVDDSSREDRRALHERLERLERGDRR